MYRMKHTRKQSFRIDPYVKYVTRKLMVKRLQKENRSPIQWNRLQRGGGDKEITHVGYTFLYTEEEDSILCLGKKGGICFHVFFEPENALISIDIGYFRNCSRNVDLPEGSGTLVMLQVVMQLILRRKEIDLYKKITITDNSTINCKSVEDGNTYQISLMDMYYVSTGCTWYSSLAPMFLHKTIDDTIYREERMHIVGPTSLNWNTFIERLSEATRTAFTTVVSFDEIDPTTPGSASAILNKIRKSRTYCYLFYKYVHELMLKGFIVGSLQGKEWCIPLKNGKIVATHEDPVLISCKNEKGWILSESYISYISGEEYQFIKKEFQLSAVSSVHVEKL